MKKYLCIDIGGTAIKYGVISDDEVFLCNGEMATEAYKGGNEILAKTEKLVRSFTEKYELCGICIATAGMVDADKGEIFYAGATIPNYAGTKFKEVLEREFNIPCEVDNDVNCAGLAEFVSGAAKGRKNALMLTVGTGIGGCIMLNGEVVRGAIGAACEVGYINMEGSDFQSLGSASTLVNKVTERKNAHAGEWDGKRIFAEAKNGDAICNQAIDEMADVLGKGIANICYVINPEAVVLGGGIMSQKEFLYEKIRESVNRYLVPVIAQNTEILFAKHKNHAGMLGAFYHFRQKH